MSKLVEYLAFAKAHPELFMNPSGGIEILLDEAEILAVEAQMARRLEARGFPTTWGQVGIVYEDQFGRILRDAVRFPDGQLGTYIRFISKEEAGPGVVVLPLYQGQVLLVRRFHHTTRTWHLEIPCRPGRRSLSAEENARKMLMEEIGATLCNLALLGWTDSGPGIAGDHAKFFYANIASYGHANINEGIADLLLTTVPEFERMIRENEISDGFTLVAFTRAKLQGLL